MCPQCLEGVLLVIEHPRPAFEDIEVDAGDLHDRSSRRERSAQNRNPTLVSHRIGHRPHHILLFRKRDAFQVLGHRLAGHGERVAVDQPFVVERTQNHRHTADTVEVDHVIPAERLQVTHVWCLPADSVEVLERQIDTSFVSDCEQVEHRVRRPAEGHHHGDSVLKRLAGHDVPGSDVGAQQFHGCLPRLPCIVVEPRGDRRNGRAPGKRHAERFADRRHRVRREHPRTRAIARAGGLFDTEQLFVVDTALGVGPNALENVDDRNINTVELAGKRRTSIEEYRGQVVPGRCHQHPRQGLVTPGNRDHRIEPLSVHHQLDRVGDDLSRHERGAHPLVAH